jgi:hypothetical protein
MPSKVYRFAYADSDLISRLIKQDYRAEKIARRGNVIWALTRNLEDKREVKAFLITRDIAGWLAKEIQSWGNKYFTCPLSYIAAADIVPNDPVYRVWVQALRDHYKQLGKNRKKYNRNRKQIQIGDIIRLNYRNLPQGMVIKLDPLTIMYNNRTYTGINMRVFDGWVTHVREKAKEERGDTWPSAQSSEKS